MSNKNRTRPRNCNLHPHHQEMEDFERFWHKRANEAREQLTKAREKGADLDELIRLGDEHLIAAKTASYLMQTVQQEQLCFRERMFCGGGCAIDITIAPENDISSRIFLELEASSGVLTVDEEQADKRVFVYFDYDQAKRVAYALLSLAERKIIPHTFDYTYRDKKDG